MLFRSDPILFDADHRNIVATLHDHEQPFPPTDCLPRVPIVHFILPEGRLGGIAPSIQGLSVEESSQKRVCDDWKVAAFDSFPFGGCRHIQNQTGIWYLWYPSDLDTVNGLAHERKSDISEAPVDEDFVVMAG